MPNFYKNKKIFVTGATGFKGSWLCFWLTILGAKVVGTGMRRNSQKLFYQLNLHKKIRIHYLDIANDYEKLKFIIKKFKPSIIFHLAAQPLVRESYKKPLETFHVNILGTANILDISYNVKSVRSLLCITSDKVYYNENWVWGYREKDKIGGDDPYSASKASAELVIQSYRASFGKKNPKLGVASCRAGNVIGGGDMSKDRLIPDSIKNLLNNKKIIIRNPNANRPWQHVLEPLHGYLVLAKKLFYEQKKYSGPYNFGPSTTSILNVKSVVEKIIKIWGSGKLKVIKKKNEPKEQQILQLNIDKSIQVLKWKPIYSLAETILVTVFWYKQVFFYKNNPIDITAKQILEYQKNIK